MRRFVLIAILALLAVPVQAPAATLATCGATTPNGGGSTGQPFSFLDGKCDASFSITGTAEVTVTAEPTPGFTGPLYAAVRKPGVDVGMGANGFYVAGVLVLGDGSETFTLDGGLWTLEVHAGSVPPCLARTPLPDPLPVDDNCWHTAFPAIGAFAGSATTL